jgi:hypothetical protein
MSTGEELLHKSGELRQIDFLKEILIFWDRETGGKKLKGP